MAGSPLADMGAELMLLASLALTLTLTVPDLVLAKACQWYRCEATEPAAQVRELADKLMRKYLDDVSVGRARWIMERLVIEVTS